MISQCVNPDCHAEFRVFNSGFLYALERPSADTEFFWLCSLCADRFKPCLGADGEVAVMPRLQSEGGLPPRWEGEIRLVSAPAQRIPWRSAIPSDETAHRFRFGFAECHPADEV